MKTHLYIRIKAKGKSRPFCEPVYAKNHKLSPGYALVNGLEEHHPEGVYHLRYLRGGKRIWESLGSDAQTAQTKQLQRNLILASQEAGVEVVEPNPTGHDLGKAIGSYLTGVSVSKSVNTYNQYEYVLRVFKEVTGAKTLEAITRDDVLLLRDHFIGRGGANYSIGHHLTNLRTFLTYYDRPWPLKKTDRLTATKKVVSAYSHEEIAAMFRVANQEEADLLWFLLGTGVRKDEALHATWANVDFIHAAYAIREKADWTPKDREEGIIPIPQVLVARLQARRLRYPGSTRIFATLAKNPGKEMLNTIKGLAYRAGLNCGECLLKPSKAYPKGRCCATAPICERYICHKFRRTFATWHSEAGVPVHTIQRWLRHSSLETTLRYLAGSDDNTDFARARVESTFAELAA
jgi:integrase